MSNNAGPAARGQVTSGPGLSVLLVIWGKWQKKRIKCRRFRGGQTCVQILLLAA